MIILVLFVENALVHHSIQLREGGFSEVRGPTSLNEFLHILYSQYYAGPHGTYGF